VHDENGNFNQWRGTDRGKRTSPRHDNSRSQADWFRAPDEPSNRSAREEALTLSATRSDCRAAALAIAGIGYGGIVMFHSFTHETTDDAFVDVHTVSVAPKVAGHVAVVRVDDNQLVKKGDVLVEIDPRDFKSHWRRRKRTWQETRPRKYKQN